MKCSWTAINHASLRGHVAVLQWFLDNRLEMRYDERAIIYASLGGHVSVLQWFLDNRLEMRYDERAINHASLEGHVAVLQWFLDNGLEMRYNERARNMASARRELHSHVWMPYDKRRMYLEQVRDETKEEAHEIYEAASRDHGSEAVILCRCGRPEYSS